MTDVVDAILAAIDRYIDEARPLVPRPKYGKPPVFTSEQGARAASYQAGRLTAFHEVRLAVERVGKGNTP